MSSNGDTGKDGLLNSSCSDESIHTALTQGRESAITVVIHDKGVGQSTELQDGQETGHRTTSHKGEQGHPATSHKGKQGHPATSHSKEQGHPATSHGREQGHPAISHSGEQGDSAAVQEKESSTFDVVEPKKRPPIVSLHVYRL